MTTTATPTPDLVVVKHRQRQAWGSGDYVQARPAARRGQPPGQWGTRERLSELLGAGVSRLTATEREFVFRFRSPDDFADFFRANYGPVHKAFEALDEAGRQRLHDDLTALASRHDRSPGPSVAMASGYLEVVATRR